MSNVYTKDLSNEIYFLNDKNVVLEIDVNGVINPIASHLLVKNISDDVASYIEKTDNSIETISSDISSLLKKDLEIINNIDEVKSELISNIISTSHNLSTYSDTLLEIISSLLVSNITSTADALSTYSNKQLSTISSLIDTKIDNISSKVAVAYRPMGSVNSYNDLLDKLSAYLSSSIEKQIDSHIGEVWNVINPVSTSGVVETSNNYVFVKVSDGNGYKYEWDDIGGIVDLSEYALSSDVAALVATLSNSISAYINSVSTTVSNTVESNFVHISGDTITGNLKVNSLTSTSDISAETLYIGSTVKIEKAKVALGNSNTTNNGQFVWNGIVSSEYSPPSAYGTFNINPSASINGVIVGAESLSSIISSVILTSSEQVSNLVTSAISTVSSEILRTVTDINTNLSSADEYISGRIDNILTVTIPNINTNIETISNDVLEITSTSIPNINKNISAISTDVGTLFTNVDVALEQVLKTVEFVGHVTFSSPDDARKTASTLSDLIHKFNIPEKSRIKNGAMYHVEFILSSDNIPANELAEYYVDVKIDENNSVRISHGDYIIFHDHETKQFIDISSITKENIYVTEVSFSDLYSLSTTVSAKIEDLSNTISRDYAYLNGNNKDNEHLFTGTHDFTERINVSALSASTLSATNISATNISATNISADNISASGIISAQTLCASLHLSAPSATITSATITNLTGTNISASERLSAKYIETPSSHISDEVVSNLTGTNAIITNLTGTNISASERLSAKYIETPLAHISSAILSVVDVTNALSVNFGNVYDKGKKQSLSTQLDKLSTAIDNKIWIKDPTVAELENGKHGDLSVIKLTPNDYIAALTSDAICAQTLYVLCADYVDAFGQVISNAVNTSAAYSDSLSGYINDDELTTISKRGSFKESEVATVEFVNTIVQSRITNSYNKIYKALSVL